LNRRIWCIKSGPHGGRPTLFCRDGRLFAECGDGRLLHLLAVELDGSPLASLPAAASSGERIDAIPGNSFLSLS
jgi:hypothetical protein